MLEITTVYFLILITFFLGYLAIIFEYNIKVNKTASGLLMAVLTWSFLFLAQGEHREESHYLGEKVNETSQIIFFLLGAMTLVELIDSHKGFKVVTDLIQTGSKKKMLWIIGLAAFFLSPILDNLTTTIVMISLLRKLVPDRKERVFLSSVVVIAANAGGAWSPIGDVTTTMLWIEGNITTLGVVRELLLPSLVSLFIALFLVGFRLRGRYPQLVERAHQEPVEPGARLVFFCGIGGLIFVPVFKTLTGLPPFMGILIALGVLWLITDILHAHEEGRRHLRVPHVLTKIDTSGVLFFLGILLCIGALEAVGMLSQLALWLDHYVGSLSVIATAIGILSAVIDNVPLVAATMGMYSVQTYPVDSFFWMMIAFCAGTGGSILIIGSAAGVALMGLEKVDFLWYLRHIAWVALFSYLGGVGSYLLQSAVLSR